eukprot:4195796-Ditylum_brightwellii.AAC.2
MLGIFLLVEQRQKLSQVNRGGGLIGPILFIVYMTAMLITWKRKKDQSICLFRTKKDGILIGHHFNTARGMEEFEMNESVYPDDAAFLFNSQEEAEMKTPHIMQHYCDWEIDVHHGLTATENKKGKPSKTELLFVAKPPHSYATASTYGEADFSPIIMEDRKFIPVVHKLCYLGSMIKTDLRGKADVDNFIKKASKAFEALRHGIFSSTKGMESNKEIYLLAQMLPCTMCPCHVQSHQVLDLEVKDTCQSSSGNPVPG